MKSTELDLKNSRDKESLDGLMKEVESGWKNSQLGLLKKERSKSCPAFSFFFHLGSERKNRTRYSRELFDRNC
jgi:hypothetical protein